jgi:hypothetical protein
LFVGWSFSPASFNAGVDKIEEAIAKGKARDFWRLGQLAFLPGETRAYVPIVVRAARAWRVLEKGTQGIAPFEKTDASLSQR